MHIVFVILVLFSIFLYIFGTFLPINNYQNMHGISGYRCKSNRRYEKKGIYMFSVEAFIDNLLPFYHKNETFFSIFGVYFSIMTSVIIIILPQLFIRTLNNANSVISTNENIEKGPTIVEKR